MPTVGGQLTSETSRDQCETNAVYKLGRRRPRGLPDREHSIQLPVSCSQPQRQQWGSVESSGCRAICRFRRFKHIHLYIFGIVDILSLLDSLYIVFTDSIEHDNPGVSTR